MAQATTKPETDATMLAPEPCEFAAQPATWYLFGQSSDVKKSPISKTVLGQRLVAFRDSAGVVNVMDARCAHLGADLGRGRIVGDSIQCPFHHWRYSTDGQCVSIPNRNPGCGDIPKSTRLRVYPVEERHGHVFFFFGSKPLFPLPFFSNCATADFVASRPFQFVMDSPWFMLVGNGFDGQHFHSVHDRKLVSEPIVDCPAPMARRIRFEAEVIGTSIFDRLLKRFAGRKVRVSITSWGGPYILVEGVFGRAHSRLLVASQPIDDTNTFAEVIVFCQRTICRPFDAFNLRVRRRFTRAFLQYDIDKLSGVRYQPQGLIEQDAELVGYLQWAAGLPRSDYEVAAKQ